MQLAIIIVNFRTAQLVVDCLSSLQAPDMLPPATWIVVVDGCSGDDSIEKISAAIRNRGWTDRVTFLALPVNGGFAYANNRGMEHVLETRGKPSYFLLLNPDTVARPNSIRPLIDFMEANPSVGITGSRLEDPDGTPQACAFRFPSIGGEFESESRFGPISRLLNRWRLAPELPSVPTRIDWISGASMMVRSKVIDDIGTMDEGYFLYYEELDFTIRAARAGWECWHVPESRVIHLVGRSTGVTVRETLPRRRPAYWFESRRRYFIKTYGRAYMLLVDVAWIAGHCIWRLRQFMERRQRQDPPHLLRDFIRNSAFLRGL